MAWGCVLFVKDTTTILNTDCDNNVGKLDMLKSTYLVILLPIV